MAEQDPAYRVVIRLDGKEWNKEEESKVREIAVGVECRKEFMIVSGGVSWEQIKEAIGHDRFRYRIHSGDLCSLPFKPATAKDSRRVA